MSAALKTGFSHCRVLQELVLLLVIVDRLSAPVSQTKILPITFNTRNVFLQNGFILTSFLIVPGKGRVNG